MTGRVDDVNFHFAIGRGHTQRRVFRHEGDVAFALQIHRVHHALLHFLIGAEGVRLLQHGINERGFAVVNVRGNGDIAEVATHGQRFFVFVHFGLYI